MWDTIGKEFVTMVSDSIRRGNLPNGMNRGMIVLLHKDKNKEDLTN
jgi:hypothetical protein